MTALLAPPPAVARYRFDHEGHVHTLDSRPLCGTSTVTGSTGPKHGLEWWSAELAAVECLEAGTHIPTIRAEVEAYRALHGNDKKKALTALQKKYPVFKAARYAHRNAKEKAAGPGTDMHKHLEDYLVECMESGGAPLRLDAYAAPAVEIFAEWALQNVDEFLASEAHCFSERLWTGGIVDGVATMRRDHGYAVIDFKSSKEAYFSQFIQAGGYAEQIAENGLCQWNGQPLCLGVQAMECTSLIVFPFGGNCQPVTWDDVPAFRAQFEAAVATYKLQQLFTSQTNPTPSYYKRK